MVNLICLFVTWFAFDMMQFFLTTWIISLNLIFNALFEPPYDKTNKMACAPSEDWASTQSDQSLRCPHEESLGL